MLVKKILCAFFITLLLTSTTILSISQISIWSTEEWRDTSRRTPPSPPPITKTWRNSNFWVKQKTRKQKEYICFCQLFGHHINIMYEFRSMHNLKWNNLSNHLQFLYVMNVLPFLFSSSPNNNLQFFFFQIWLSKKRLRKYFFYC